MRCAAGATGLHVAILVSVAWTETENDVAIAAYFDLLVRTLNGERVNKAALYHEVARRLGHNRAAARTSNTTQKAL